MTKVRCGQSFVSIITPDASVALDINNLTPVEINSEMRENIPNLSKLDLIGFNQEGEVINAETFVETPKAVKTEAVKAKVDNADAQLSLFDLFERDAKN